MSTSNSTYYWGTGRRKSAVARVRLKSGEGKITINGKPVEAYFVDLTDQVAAAAPLKLVKGTFDVLANCNGGGLGGQADAVRLGIARALCLVSEEYEPIMREHKLLTRDSRMPERKKYGRKGARARFQFSKR